MSSDTLAWPESHRPGQAKLGLGWLLALAWIFESQRPWLGWLYTYFDLPVPYYPPIKLLIYLQKISQS